MYSWENCQPDTPLKFVYDEPDRDETLEVKMEINGVSIVDEVNPLDMDTIQTTAALFEFESEKFALLASLRGAVLVRGMTVLLF